MNRIGKRYYTELIKKLDKLNSDAEINGKNLNRAIQMGDLRENADYDYCTNKREEYNSKIKALKDVLEHYIPTEEKLVILGSRVVLENSFDSKKYEYYIVLSEDANILDGRLNCTSIMAKKLIGLIEEDVFRNFFEGKLKGFTNI